MKTVGKVFPKSQKTSKWNAKKTAQETKTETEIEKEK